MPHNMSCEAGVLGGIILRNDVLALLPDLEGEDFYNPRHRIVFEAIRELEATHRPIDILTLEAEIDRRGKLEAIGGVATLGELVLRVPTADNVVEYAKIIVDARVKRDVILKLAELTEEAYLDTTGEQLVHDVTTQMMGIRVGKEVRVVTMGMLAAEEAVQVRADHARKKAGHTVYTGIPTGIVAIDERCGGHPLGVPTYYIARPSFGKTTHAMNVVKNAKVIADIDSLLVSVEDGPRGFGQRALAQESWVSTERLRARKVTDADIPAIIDGSTRALATRGEWFAHMPGAEAEQIVRLFRRENAKRVLRGKPKLRQLVVDYLQKVKWPRWAKGSDDAVGHISGVFTQLAAEDDVAVVAFCQLNRDVEKRPDHQPRISDIRDSGKVEQDGRLIIGIHWPHAYEPNKYDATLAKLLILKNTQGASHFDADVYWDLETHGIYNSAMDCQTARSMRHSYGGR